MSSIIELKDVKKTYQMGHHQYEALKGVDLTIAEGELVAIIGSSGSGKTTMMNIIGLLDHPTSGVYYLNGKSAANLNSDEQAALRNRSIGFIFQSFFLLPRLTALQNVGLPLNYRGVEGKIIKENALKMLARVGLRQLYDHRPNQLSGGQQQRVAIARALIGHPHIILADEPTGALDSKTTDEILNLMVELNKTEGTTVVIITHDITVAERCSRIVKIDDGRITSSNFSRHTLEDNLRSGSPE